MKKNRCVAFFLILPFLTFAQKSQYYIVFKQDTPSFEEANSKSKIINKYLKGKKLDITGQKGDFVKTVDNQYIHRSKILILENKTYRVNEEIERQKTEYKDRMKQKTDDGINLNSNSRDFIELPVKDTVKFENLKIKNE